MKVESEVKTKISTSLFMQYIYENCVDFLKIL